MEANNFSHFKRCIDRYQKFLNLQNWQIHIDISENITARASTFWGDLNDGGQIISIYASKGWLNNPETTLFEIERTAFHECCEILLCRLSFFAGNNELLRTDREIVAEKHGIIRTLENNVLPYLIKYRNQ